MATPISWAQEVITCDLCDNATQQFCNNCQVSLCEDCINKHIKKHKSLTHDIVPFKNRKIQLVFPECEFHPHLRCEAHCQQCDVPVCMKCVIASHNGHNVKDIPNIFNEKKKEIEMETHEIKYSIIPKCKKTNEDTERYNALATKRFIELEKETEKNRKVWHQEVDNIFNKLRSLIKSMKNNNDAVLKSYQLKLRNLITDLSEKVKKNNEMLNSSKVTEVTNYKSQLMEYRRIPDIDLSIPSLETITVKGKELRIELGKYKATLTQTSLSSLTDEVSMKELLDKARVFATFPTGRKPLLNLACVGDDQAWITGKDNFIRRVNTHGIIQKTVTCAVCPNDISVTRQGELIYDDYANGTVNIVRDGKTEVMVTTPRGWYPYRLCCTKSGDILVNLTNGSQNKIVRYQGQSVMQEVYQDENGKLIYECGKWMLFVAENNNKDICVSDYNAKTVVVVDNTGKIRFRYDGTPARRKQTFDPRNIVTDLMSQIIVADCNNDCLHILDQDGHFLRCVDSCGLSQPSGLSLDSEGRLWVGSYDKGEVKVIKYTK